MMGCGFPEIKRAYSDYYRSLLAEGKLNCRDTGIGFWGCSSPDAVHDLFEELAPARSQKFMDLGSGDGVVAAIAGLFMDSTGVEFDRDLHAVACSIKARLGLKHRLLNQDFSRIDISGYDIVYVNPDKGFSRGLEKKLLRELTGTLIVHNDIFQPDFLEKGRTIWHDQIPMTLFTNPSLRK
jgi:hypothetical protein